MKDNKPRPLVHGTDIMGAQCAGKALYPSIRPMSGNGDGSEARGQKLRSIVATATRVGTSMGAAGRSLRHSGTSLSVGHEGEG
jgi:hypothetical protein